MTVFDLYDMHCHLAFSPDTRASAIALRQEGIGGMCATVTPDEYHLASLALADELNRNSNFKLGVGLHPWWLSDGSCGADAVDKLVAYAAETRFIGEIGLDFAPRRAAWCAAGPAKPAGYSGDFPLVLWFGCRACARYRMRLLFFHQSPHAFHQARPRVCAANP